MIKILNKYGEELKAPDIIELAWNRKYYEAGTFSVYMPAKNYNEDFKYVQLAEREETGVIQKIVYEETPHGDYVTLSGFFLEKLLDGGSPLQNTILYEPNKRDCLDRLRLFLYTTFRQETQSLKNSITKDVSEMESFQMMLEPVLYETRMKDNGIGPAELSEFVNAGEPVGRTLYKLFKNSNISYFAVPRFNRAKDETKPLIGLEVVPRKGRDLKRSVYFGKTLGNVSKVTYAYDDSGARPVVKGLQLLPEGVQYTDALPQIGPDWKTDWYALESYDDPSNEPVGLGKSRPTKVIQTNIENITSGNEEVTRSKMKQALKLEMLNSYKEETINVDIIQSRFIYRKDYDLGDEVTLLIDALQKQYGARIIEVREVYSKNAMAVELVLGTPRKQEYRKVVI